MTEKLDILFVNPGNPAQIFQTLADEFTGVEPPVFAGLFATYARRKGYRVAILDAPAARTDATETARIATEDYDATLIVIPVYGAQPSASTQNMGSAGDIARAIKERDATARILMTGTHPAALPERTMREESIDFVCDLEGPRTICETAEALKSGVDDFGAIASLWWRDGDRIVPPAKAAPLLVDLDMEMPGIAWDLMQMDRYRAHNWHSFEAIDQRSPYAAIHTSLGCPFRCSFCCINAPFGKPAYRMWSPDTVVGEIDLLVEKYGVRHIKFVDEMFVLNKSHVLGICDLLAQRDYAVNIWAYARVDTVKDQFLDRLKAAGVNWLCLGIESASEYVRDGADKRYGNREIFDVVRRIQSAGINVLGNYIFGLPDDTPERMQQTLDLALELNCEFANFYCAMPYPGSALYRMAAESGMELPRRWRDYSQHGYDTTPLANDHCTADEILAFRDSAWSAYFTDRAYLRSVGKKFGPTVVDHVRRMTQIPLPRRYREKAVTD